MSDSQDTWSSGSAFRGNEREAEVVEEMCKAAERMGKGMPIGLDGDFDYRGIKGGVESEEVESTDQSSDDSRRGGDRCVAGAKAGSGGEGNVDAIREGWSADEHQSTMTQQKLEKLREEYDIPTSVSLRAPTGDERPSKCPLGWVTMCADMLKQGVQLPLSPFLQEWMGRLCVAPHQMNPNVYKTMVSVQALWQRVHKSESTINQMLHCFLLKRSPHQVGFCYLHSAVGKVIESNPSS